MQRNDILKLLSSIYNYTQVHAQESLRERSMFNYLFREIVNYIMLFTNRLWASRPYRAPPPRMIESRFIFFVWVSSATKIFSSKKKVDFVGDIKR